MQEQGGLFSDEEYLLKHVNAVALMPVAGGRRISLLGRRLFNVLLHRAQEEGERDEYEARMHEIVGDARYNSNDTAPIRKILKELMTTTVEWQSPSSGEIETWDACNLLSGAGTTKDRRTNAVTVRWRYDTKVRAQLLSPDRYARLSLEVITQLSSHASMALYEICARYVDNPGHKTARQHWRWWRPVLTGVVTADSKAEYRFFKRDVLHKAIAEINACTNLDVRGPVEYKGQDNKTINDIQFEVYLKDAGTRDRPKPLAHIGTAELPIVGRAIAAGVPQSEVESLVQKFGPGKVFAAVQELEKRLQMPSEKVGAVHKPGSWLKAHLTRRQQKASEEGATTQPDITQEALTKHRAAWTDEWLRRRKDRLRRGFEELPESKKATYLEDFRRELNGASEVQMLKRFDSSGWQHRLVTHRFMRFFGASIIGADWDKPTPDDILGIAAELANQPQAQTFVP